VAGYRLLRDTRSTYRDGGEAAVLDIIERATDRSSGSDEMGLLANGFAQSYHVDPARANIVRALRFPPGAHVLEIGAGCGAVTRFLGETCGLVDALEPVPVRAAAAAARTRDLDNVQVFVGETDDLPCEPTYDVAVVVGVLEYVGRGSAEAAPYLEFLGAIRDRLKPDGALVLAIENQLGVKYWAGSPEDHTGRPFDSVEGYRRAARPVRTFSRHQLQDLLAAAGFESQIRIAFPDYKLTRTVLGDLPAGARTLAHRIPSFPSADRGRDSRRTCHEASVWRTIVEAHLEPEFGNSFLALAGKDGPPTLWPAHQLGAFYSEGRRAELQMQTALELVDERVMLHRSPLSTANGGGGGQRLRGGTFEFIPSRDAVDVIVQDGLAAARPILTRWIEFLDQACVDGQVQLDLVPHNLVIEDGSDEIRIIDTEFDDWLLPREQVVRRGIFELARRVVNGAPPGRWAAHRTIGGLMRELGTTVGLPADGSWLQTAAREEAALQARIRPGPPAGMPLERWVEQLQQASLSRLRRRLESVDPDGPGIMARAVRRGGRVARRAVKRAARRDAG
jgi:SAM-dependent methyltransferase